MMISECPDALCLMYCVKKSLKQKSAQSHKSAPKFSKVLKVLKSAGPVNYNYPPIG